MMRMWNGWMWTLWAWNAWSCCCYVKVVSVVLAACLLGSSCSLLLLLLLFDVGVAMTANLLFVVGSHSNILVDTQRADLCCVCVRVYIRVQNLLLTNIFNFAKKPNNNGSNTKTFHNTYGNNNATVAWVNVFSTWFWAPAPDPSPCH